MIPSVVALLFLIPAWDFLSVDLFEAYFLLSVCYILCWRYFSRHSERYFICFRYVVVRLLVFAGSSCVAGGISLLFHLEVGDLRRFYLVGPTYFLGGVLGL